VNETGRVITDLSARSAPVAALAENPSHH
jgi:hypothetical protein